MSLPLELQAKLEDVHEVVLESLESHDFIDPVYDIVHESIREAFLWADADKYSFDESDYVLVALKEIVLQIQQQVNQIVKEK